MSRSRRLRSIVSMSVTSIVALLGIGVVAGCGSPDADRVPGPALLDEFAPAVVGTVAVDAAGFDTESLDVTAGDAIELANDDDGAVRVQGRIDDDLRYDTGDMRAGEVTVLAFLEPGEVVFTVVDPEPPAGDEAGDQPGGDDDESATGGGDARSTSLTISVTEADQSD